MAKITLDPNLPKAVTARMATEPRLSTASVEKINAWLIRPWTTGEIQAGRWYDMSQIPAHEHEGLVAYFTAAGWKIETKYDQRDGNAWAFKPVAE